jgi:hypothetical protein
MDFSNIQYLGFSIQLLPVFHPMSINIIKRDCQNGAYTHITYQQLVDLIRTGSRIVQVVSNLCLNTCRPDVSNLPQFCFALPRMHHNMRLCVCVCVCVCVCQCSLSLFILHSNIDTSPCVCVKLSGTSCIKQFPKRFRWLLGLPTYMYHWCWQTEHKQKNYSDKNRCDNAWFVACVVSSDLVYYGVVHRTHLEVHSCRRGKVW